MKPIKRIGILTGGGDAPGLNAVIRGAAKSIIHNHDAEVFGFSDGYRGLVTGEGRWLQWNDVSSILTLGGTILGTTNRDNPFAFVDDHDRPDKKRDASRDAMANYRRLKLDALVTIGGDGTLASAHLFAKKGMNVIAVPKTIDNDVRGTDLTFGFITAVTTATEAIDKIHTTAASHHRVMLVEVMGRTAGWLALTAGMAGGGDVILLPEIPYRLEAIHQRIQSRIKWGKRFSIIVVSEGAHPAGGSVVVRQRVEGSHEAVRLGGISALLAQQLEETCSLECRYCILGHLQRGGTPAPYDRFLATQFGAAAAELIGQRKFNRMVALRGNRIVDVALTVPGQGPRLVPRNSPVVRMAESLGTSFGV